MKSKTVGKSIKLFDWEGIHKKIRHTQEVLEKGWIPTPEEERKILLARAAKLAHESAKPDDEKKIDVVKFQLAYETYAVESIFVREVFPLKGFTKIPGTPAFVLGVTNVRGRIIFVIDIKKFFGLPEKGLTDLNKLIILEAENSEFGILADFIIGLDHVAQNEIQKSLPTLTPIREDFLKGVTKERLIILDAEKLLKERQHEN